MTKRIYQYNNKIQLGQTSTKHTYNIGTYNKLIINLIKIGEILYIGTTYIHKIILYCQVVNNN